LRRTVFNIRISACYLSSNNSQSLSLFPSITPEYPPEISAIIIIDGRYSHHGRGRLMLFIHLSFFSRPLYRSNIALFTYTLKKILHENAFDPDSGNEVGVLTRKSKHFLFSPGKSPSDGNFTRGIECDIF
jgi:hypothetical protein